MVDSGAGPDAVGGGIGPSQAPGDTGVKIYVRVDDLEGRLARAGELGADTLAPPRTGWIRAIREAGGELQVAACGRIEQHRFPSFLRA